MLYHHCRPLESVIYGEVAGRPEFCHEDYIKSSRWLEKEIGFFPIFTSVGETDVSRRETGYQNNWRRLIEYSLKCRKYKKKSEFPNEVLFTFENLNGGVYIHSDYFIVEVIMPAYYDRLIPESVKKYLFKKSYSESRWLNFIRKHSDGVYYLVPKLDLTSAREIWVRNNKTKKKLEIMGFNQVEVKRLSVENFL